MITQSDRDGWGLLTDLYELTMAYGYWQHAMADREAVFHLSFREHPYEGSYTIAAGLGHLCELLHDFHFSTGDIQYLAAVPGADGRPLFSRSFLDYLARLRLTCQIDAVEEGTVVFPHEPLIRVRGPLLQAQIIESILLNVINFQTLIATKAARICQAAAPGSVVEFGLRRAQGESGALAATRAAYIGGCSGTSNVLAGKRYGIPVRGTHAHSWVMAFDSELDAFAKYAEAMPNNCIFLVDTFDTLQGLRNAVEVARGMQAAGHRLVGIRLDSGDLVALSQAARTMLNDAGLEESVVVASNDLDEYEIARLKSQGAQIDVWGVGTRLITSYDQPALGGVYKLSAIRDASGEWQRKLKLSEQPRKISTPGILQIRRFTENGHPRGDIVFDELAGLERPARGVEEERPFRIPEAALGNDLLVPVYRNGELVYKTPSLDRIRQRTRDQLKLFENFVRPAPMESGYPVGLESRLSEMKRHLSDVAREA